MHEFRTHKCGELRKGDIGTMVKISGWVHRVRDHGGILFIDLRDDDGISQVVIDPNVEFYADIDHWRVESVLSFVGKVVARTEDAINTKLVRRFPFLAG